LSGETIFALATAPGRAALAVMRVSGSDARAIYQSLAGKPPPPRRAALRKLRDAAGTVLDEALTLWFQGPNSYTGEDAFELHLHGGPAVIAAVSEALAAAGARPAEPGEFTRRAFANGKLSLDQAEAIADLVDAETRAQARQALEQLGGALSARHEIWRADLIAALARLEAAVDFPDEEVPEDVAEAARAPLGRLAAGFAQAAGELKRGEAVRDGYRIALVGAPNAGKSTLINRLAGREAAIVTPTPGTTRDIIEAPLTLDGYRVLLADTAGLRESADPIEAEGVRRARAWAENAALRLWVVDGSASDDAWRAGFGEIMVIAKTDLPEGADAIAAAARARAEGLEVWRIGRETPDAEIRARLTGRVIADLAGAEFPAATRARHARLLLAARDHIERAQMVLHEPELAAEDVRLAARSLAQITGTVGAEDVLGEVFASFCIGK
jgi:tRNA modification GTPase